MTNRDGAVLWQCFRARCGIQGGSGNTTPSVPSEVRAPKPRWEGDTHELPDKVKERVAALWGLSEVPDWYWTTDMGGRIAMSVRDPQDVHRGWVLRAITSGARAKALTYIEQGESLSWYKRHQSAPTLLVEDIPSALRASKYVNAVALLGTTVSSSKALEIAKHSTKPVIIALDQDATSLSFWHKKRYDLLWDGAEILLLTKDIKDMKEKELWKLFTQ